MVRPLSGNSEGSGKLGENGGQGRGRGGRRSRDEFSLGGSERLQKFLSHAGVDSRRQCEQMILDGRVKVNGKMAKELGLKVDPTRDAVLVDGKRVNVRPKTEFCWVALNKPKGVISSTADELGRKTVVQVIPGAERMRLVPVGRLDRDTCGLLLLTNENSWINPLIHPSYGHEKTYRVTISSGFPDEDAWKRVTEGMLLEGDPNPTMPCYVELVDYDKQTSVTVMDVIIREGRNRQIRRMFEGIGHNVRSITRISHGPVRLKGLRPGQWRRLDDWEIKKLKNLTTKTLKAPSSQGRRGGHSGGTQGPHVHGSGQEAGRTVEDEEDEWNMGSLTKGTGKGAYSRGGGGGATRNSSSVRGERAEAWKDSEWVQSEAGRRRGGSERKAAVARGSGGWREGVRKGGGTPMKSSPGKAQVATGLQGGRRMWEGRGMVDTDNRPSRTKKPWEASKGKK